MRTKFLIVSFIMILDFIPGLLAQNLILNGGFENIQEITNTADWEKPFFLLKIDNWYSAQGTPQLWARNKFIQVNASPHTGDVVPYMVASYDSNLPDPTKYGSEGIFQNIPWNVKLIFLYLAD